MDLPRYPARPEAVVLSNFSLDVRPGEVLALVSTALYRRSSTASCSHRCKPSVHPYSEAPAMAGSSGLTRPDIVLLLRSVPPAEERVPCALGPRCVATAEAFAPGFVLAFAKHVRWINGGRFRIRS